MLFCIPASVETLLCTIYKLKRSVQQQQQKSIKKHQSNAHRQKLATWDEDGKSALYNCQERQLLFFY